MTEKDKLRRVSCLFTCNDLNSLPPDEHMKYCHLAQLLRHMTSSSLGAYQHSGLLLSLRTLQRDAFLGTGEKPVPRHIQHGSKNKKQKMKTNADTMKKFICRWAGNKRGRLFVVQNIPIPEDGTHPATIIPAVLNGMIGKFPTLK